MVGMVWDGPYWILSFLPGIHTLCNPFPWVWARFSDWILANRTQQRWWNVTSVIKWPKTVTFISDILPHGLRWKVVAILWTGPWRRCPLTRSWVRPQDNSQYGIETFSPTACKGLSPANNHGSELGRRAFPRPAFMWECNAFDTLTVAWWETLSQRHPLTGAWLPEPQKLWHGKYLFL